MKILVTGGAGYIGSHTCVELISAGHDVVVMDNLSNSHIEVFNRMKNITGHDIPFYEADLLDKDALTNVFENESVDAVIHFAGLKAVGESVEKPFMYYNTNLISTLNLVDCMKRFNVTNLVFSSSATVYGFQETMPLSEDFPLSATNPYGRTKLMIEEMLEDIAAADASLSISLLRYFNPIGAHESGMIGEDPNGIPNNLVPYITQVASGRLKQLHVFGTDYPTDDGTGVRDYIHVCDLADGHVKALEWNALNTGIEAFNLGTGRGTSVLEMVEAFKEVTMLDIPCHIQERRAGDVAVSYADPSKANRLLNWTAKRDVMTMCQDSWRWQKNNPQGYKTGKITEGAY
ncbi:UDP-glucose 4-epimerase GalE [Bacillus sp. A116_S68]|nr:UDP-glucose 4-epimerase GalE [Bacillus sp. A116_S68]